MPEIPNDLLIALRAALVDLNNVPVDASDARPEPPAPATQRAMDDLLAASYQIVEVASISTRLWDIDTARPAAANRNEDCSKIRTRDLALI